MAENTTVSRLIEMRLSKMASAYVEQDKAPGMAGMTFDERLAQIVDAEWDARRTSKRQRLLRQARLAFPEASVADIIWDADRGLDRASLLTLSNCVWIGDHENVCVVGASGSGKSWIACALAGAACEAFHTARYVRMPELMDELAVSRGEDWLKAKRRYVKCELLIIDDFMLEPLERREARELLELIEARYMRGSMILCSQYGPQGWHERIGEGALADAVCDRLAYNSHMIHLKGTESMRKRLARKA